MLVQTLFKSPVVRDKKYLAFIRSCACLICHTKANVQPHHENEAGHGAKGKKCDDTRTVPLCFKCHRERHDKGKATFWRGYDTEEIIGRLNAAYETATGRKIGEK